MACRDAPPYLSGILGELDERRRNVMSPVQASVALELETPTATAPPRPLKKPAVVGQVHCGRLWHLADLHLTPECVAAALGTAASARADDHRTAAGGHGVIERVSHPPIEVEPVDQREC